MAKKKYYAVRAGRTPGIYTSWDACKAQVDGFANASFKSFPTKEEAEAFLGNNTVSTVAVSCSFLKEKKQSTAKREPIQNLLLCGTWQAKFSEHRWQ